MNTVTELFGDVIHSYTRAQAIEDGVLVDLRQGELDDLAANAGIRYPIACTSAVFESCVALTPAAHRAGNDLKGRLWDVLFMLRMAIRRCGGGSEIRFEVMVVRERVRPTLTRLKAICGPGDDAEPVITIMFEGED